jgi:hypothetical protein
MITTLCRRTVGLTSLLGSNTALLSAYIQAPYPAQTAEALFGAPAVCEVKVASLVKKSEGIVSEPLPVIKKSMRNLNLNTL